MSFASVQGNRRESTLYFVYLTRYLEPLEAAVNMPAPQQNEVPQCPFFRFVYRCSTGDELLHKDETISDFSTKRVYTVPANAGYHPQ